jgi:hypothetical protein
MENNKSDALHGCCVIFELEPEVWHLTITSLNTCEPNDLVADFISAQVLFVVSRSGVASDDRYWCGCHLQQHVGVTLPILSESFGDLAQDRCCRAKDLLTIEATGKDVQMKEFCGLNVELVVPEFAIQSEAALILNVVYGSKVELHSAIGVQGWV